MEQLQSLITILTAVQALGNLAADILRSAGDADPSSTVGFQALFGSTSIFVEKDKDKVPGGYSGMNCGWEGQNGNCDHDKDLKGKFSIELALDEILAGDGPYTGLGLVTHEIGHNVTYATGQAGSGLLTRDDFKTPAGVKMLPETVFGIQAGAHNTKKDGYWPSYEFSADAIANAALDTYIGDNGDLARNAVTDWLSGNIFDFIDNMSCTVGGSGYACSGNYDG